MSATTLRDRAEMTQWLAYARRRARSDAYQHGVADALTWLVGETTVAPVSRETADAPALETIEREMELAQPIAELREVAPSADRPPTWYRGVLNAIFWGAGFTDEPPS